MDRAGVKILDSQACNNLTLVLIIFLSEVIVIYCAY